MLRSKKSKLLFSLIIILVVLGLVGFSVYAKSQVTEKEVERKIKMLEDRSFENRSSKSYLLAQVGLWWNPCRDWINDISDTIDWVLSHYNEMLESSARKNNADSWLDNQIETIRMDYANYVKACYPFLLRLKMPACLDFQV